MTDRSIPTLQTTLLNYLLEHGFTDVRVAKGPNMIGIGLTNQVYPTSMMAFGVFGNSIIPMSSPMPFPIPSTMIELMTTQGLFKNLDFSQALSLANMGFLMSRTGWNDQNLYFKHVPGVSDCNNWIEEHYELRGYDGIVLPGWIPQPQDLIGKDYFVTSRGW